jgi:diaminopropionate ammonia-lyase
MTLHLNADADRALTDAAPSRVPLAFHRDLPGYAPTPLRLLPALAARCAVARVWIKDENGRLGLPAFKILGASWAAAQALAKRLGDSGFAKDFGTLRSRLDGAPTLLAATDGNHGRAVARTAALLGLPARIIVPAGIAPARLASIAQEGATFEEIAGSYDEAVARAAAIAADNGGLLLQDTGFPGYEEIPARVAEGYSTLFWEAEEQLADIGEGPPDLLVVQVGVGALAQAAVIAAKRLELAGGTRVVGVEAEEAPCVLAALRARRVVSLPGRQHSLIAGLNCGTASTTAWPWLWRGLDGIVTVTDADAVEGMRALAAEGVVSGETGSAGAAGLLDLAADQGAREALGLTLGSRVLLISTEGATDPDSWRRLVSGPHGSLREL